MIYYAIDNSPLHLFLAEQSLKSLRKHNAKIPVSLFFFGELAAKAKKKFQGLGAQIFLMPKSKSLPPTFFKWLALSKIKSQRVLFVDADTLFFKDPEVLFKSYSKCDFYAREEYGTRMDARYSLLGNQVMDLQVDHTKLMALTAVFNFEIFPIFNSGVMLFNKGLARKIGVDLKLFSKIYQFFRDRPGFYPGQNWHIVEEIISSMVMGQMKKIKVGYLSTKDSPWYCEWKAGAVSKKGIVMHSWTKYSPFFIQEFVGPKTARRMPFLLPVSYE